MGYIKELRKIIGNRPIIMCGCGCLILNIEGKILLQKRSDDYLWGIPGGSMNLGETIYDTAKREVLEETGLIVNDLKIFNIYSGENQHHIYPNGNEAYFVSIIFITTNYNGRLKISDGESLELKFFKIDDLPADITKPNIPILNDLKDYLKSKHEI